MLSQWHGTREAIKSQVKSIDALSKSINRLDDTISTLPKNKDMLSSMRAIKTLLLDLMKGAEKMSSEFDKFSGDGVSDMSPKEAYRLGVHDALIDPTRLDKTLLHSRNSRMSSMLKVDE